MERNDTPGEDTEPIEYEAPRVLERVDIAAELSIIVSG
jgi:hypothetical protein